MANELSAIKITTGADFDDAILVAEKLMSETERQAERRRSLVVTEAAVLSFMILVATICEGLSRGVGQLRLATVSVIALLLGMLIAGAIHTLLVMPLRRRIRRDARSIIEIVGFLREVMPLLSEREGWSETQTLVAKARIARFPIGISAFL